MFLFQNYRPRYSAIKNAGKVIFTILIAFPILTLSIKTFPNNRKSLQSYLSFPCFSSAAIIRKEAKCFRVENMVITVKGGRGVALPCLSKTDFVQGVYLAL